MSSGIESHSAKEQGGRYHYPLLRTFNIIYHTHETIDDNSKLCIEFKFMNETMGTKGLVKSVLYLASYFLQY